MDWSHGHNGTIHNGISRIGFYTGGKAARFRDEVAARVARGEAACPQERVRLMWVGAGLWHDTDFYAAFEDTHGAVFVWSMYLAFGPGRQPPPDRLADPPFATAAQERCRATP